MRRAVSVTAVLAAITIHALWGGNTVAVKFSLEAFPPLWSAFLRFLIAAACIVTWARIRGLSLRPKDDEWRTLLVIGALFTVQIALMNLGIARTDAGLSSVLLATNPLFAVVFAHLLVASDRLSLRKVAGLCLAASGAALALWPDRAFDRLGITTLGNALLLASAALLGLRMALGARALARIDETRVVLWQMLIALPFFLLAGLLLEDIRWSRLGVAPVAALAYQGIVVAGLGFSVMFFLMRRYTPSVIMSFNFVAPVSGVVWAWMFLDEPLRPQLLAAVVLVAIGLTLIATRRS